MSGVGRGSVPALKGIAMAALGLGVTLILVKWVLVGLAFLGATDLRLPEALSQSGAPLGLTGSIVLMLLRERGEKEQG